MVDFNAIFPDVPGIYRGAQRTIAAPRRSLISDLPKQLVSNALYNDISDMWFHF
jgi:hypothetical protein